MTASRTPESAPFMDATAIGGVFSYLHQCAGMDEETLSRTAQAIYDTLPPRDRAGFVDAATMSGLPVEPRVADYSGTDMACQSVSPRVQHGPWSHPHAPKLQALGYGTCSALCAPDDFYELDRLQREAFYSLRPTAPLARAWTS
jgi:hypothetical protein